MQFGIINNTTIILKLIFFFHYFLQQFSIQATITNNKLVQVGKLKLSTIGVGTWSWGNRFLWQYDTNQDPELYKTYQYCIDNGINWFDTADSYGTGKLSGRSEELLGQFKQQRLEQQQEKQSQSSSFFSSFTNKNIVKSPSTSSRANIITKLAPYPWRIGTQSMITAAEQSSLRLQQPIDILQLHWPPALQWQEKEYLQAFSQIVDAGGATQIGLSNYGPKSLRRVCCILDQYQQKPYSNQVSTHIRIIYKLVFVVIIYVYT